MLLGGDARGRSLLPARVGPARGRSVLCLLRFHHDFSRRAFIYTAEWTAAATTRAAGRRPPNAPLSPRPPARPPALCRRPIRLRMYARADEHFGRAGLTRRGQMQMVSAPPFRHSDVTDRGRVGRRAGGVPAGRHGRVNRRGMNGGRADGGRQIGQRDLGWTDDDDQRGARRDGQEESDWRCRCTARLEVDISYVHAPGKLRPRVAESAQYI